MAAPLSAGLIMMSLFLAKFLRAIRSFFGRLLLGRASGMFFIAESKVFSSHSRKGLLDGGIQVDFILKLGSRVALFRP